MKILSGFFRYVLNINTIWAWMIFIAFFVCLLRHYVPSHTDFDSAILKPGANTMVITVKDDKGKPKDFTYDLQNEGGIITAKLAPAKPAETETETTPAPTATAAPAAPVEAPKIIAFKGIQTSKAVDTRMVWDWQWPGAFVVKIDDIVVTGENDKIVNLRTFTKSAFDSAETGFNIAFGFIPAFVLFLGLMKVGEDAGIVQLVANIFYPVIRFLYPEVPKDHPANGAILMNVTTTILGLGNAATPFGLKAMEHLEELNPHKGVATNAQVMMLGFNTAGLALLPTTLLAIRQGAGVKDPFAIIGTCLVAGASSTLTAIFMAKLLERLPVFSVESAAAEYEEELKREEAEKQKEAKQ